MGIGYSHAYVKSSVMAFSLMMMMTQTFYRMTEVFYYFALFSAIGSNSD
jgi:hypothetical protein